MSDLISRQAAIEAVEQIRYRIWEVDIPSPTVPEYIEHHEQMQELLARCDSLRRQIEDLPSVQPDSSACWGCNCPKMEQKTFSEMVHLHDAERRTDE